MKSLSFRLLTTAAIVLTCISGIIVLAFALLLRWGPNMLVNLELSRNAERIVSGLHFNAAGMPDRVKLNQRMTAVYSVLQQDAVYRVLDQHGAVLMSSDSGATAYAPQGEDFDPGRSRFQIIGGAGVLQVITLPFTHEDRQFYVQLMRSERMHRVIIDSDSEKTQKIVIAAAIVAMLMFSLIVVWTLHRALKPLRKASAAAEQIQVDNLSARLSLEGVPSELAPLFTAFNLALQRLDDGYRVQREFLATAAHELKTPLALIRGQIELDGGSGDGQDRSALLRDLDHMARQVHQLLHLAEASERQNYAMEEIDVKDIAAEAAAQLERLAQRRDVHVVGVANDELVMVAGDRGALFVLLRNLIENAIHHAPPGSAIDIDINRQGITVRDHGDGIAADAMPMLFKRFWRGAHRRDEGAGLGLSICEEIVRTHGWTLRAENTMPGASFRITFAPK
ncbi:sensor histidine kinase [Herbaspirillum rhizosphaerae]|uniref:sensor histidine kinase n=1 Tax=Herbaspirillum rhizosphaerae TaxID=346179 RepID=UPI00067DB2EA|nr:HAMP domain-containing sensor histidine kinase [Herbaspirillum rhizosphaerae]